MTGVIRLEIEVIDDESIIPSLVSTDVDAQDELSLVLWAVLGIAHQRVAQQLAIEDPHLNGDLRDTLASMNARREILHQVMHLPEPATRGMITTV